MLIWHWTLGSEGLWVESWRSLLALDRSPLAREQPILVIRLQTPLESRRTSGIEAAEGRLRVVEGILRPVLDRLRGGL